MHYHLEILMPPTTDIQKSIEGVLEEFSEYNEESRHSFFDWWQIGGRYSGSKLEAAVGHDKIDAFTEELKNRGVTVSGLVWGKQELSPSSQIEMVDALWREMCPGGGDVCPIFKHSGDKMNGDVSALKSVPTGLKAFRVIVAAPSYNGPELEAVFMVSQSAWNGCNHEDTTWDGTVSSAVRMFREKLDNYSAEYRKRVTPHDDWIVVTVDYHS